MAVAMAELSSAGDADWDRWAAGLILSNELGDPTLGYNGPDATGANFDPTLQVTYPAEMTVRGLGNLADRNTFWFED